MGKDKKLYRSETNKKIAGVCGGIAEYFGIDPTVIRILWFLVTWFYGIGVMVYIICAIVIPTQSDVVNRAVSQAAERQAEAQKNNVAPEAKVVEFTVEQTDADHIPE